MSETIKLWSIQTQYAYQILRKSGCLHTNGRFGWRDYRTAYRWMVERMHERGIPMIRKYPVWAWHSWGGNRKMPDLRATGHLPSGTQGVRLHLNAPRHLVLTWHR